MVRGPRWAQRLAAALLITAAFGHAGAAMANCIQSNVAGVWQYYSLTYPPSLSTAIPYWSRCTLWITASGAINPQNSFCVNQNNAAQVRVASGMIQMIGSNVCLFQGNFMLGGTRVTLERATMNLTKDHMDGIGSSGSGPSVVFNLTKL
jgi:hypothetical protein